MRKKYEILDFWYEISHPKPAFCWVLVRNSNFCAGMVKHVLSLMLSCGMYDYSGQFAFKVGLPAKSGVSGSLMIVIPNLCGICCYGPPLDKIGNSTKGLAFAKELVKRFCFHTFDNLKEDQAQESQKLDPKRRILEKDENYAIVKMLFAAKQNDINTLQQYHLAGNFDLNVFDYDGRTALHLAAAEGNYSIVEYLVKYVGVNPFIQDRFEHTAYDDAKANGHHEICDLIEDYQDSENCLFAPFV